MWLCIQLILTCMLVCIYLETIWFLLVNVLFFTVPWILWISITIYLLIRFGARVPPPDDSKVKKVLGVDPITCVENDEEEDSVKSLSLDKESIASQSKDKILYVVAHRGAGFDYPENSMSAFRYTREKGCTAIEFDLALTKDNIPIIFHDITIDRLTGFNGTIKDMTWDELKDLDISANHPLRVKFGEAEKIALFEDVVQEALDNNQRMFIDIKANGNEIVNVVVDTFNKYPKLYEMAVITSFNPVTIYMIRKRAPCIIAGISWRPQFFSRASYNRELGCTEPRFDNPLKNLFAIMMDNIHDWALNRITYYILGLSVVLLHKDTINPEVVRQWNDRGVRVLAWTVNLPFEKIHFTKNLKITYLTDTLLS